MQDVLCFLITDAPPHYLHAPSPTATREAEYLRAHGHLEPGEACDAYVVLDKVPAKHL